MRSFEKICVFTALLVIASLLGGCGPTKQARSLGPGEILFNHSMLQKGTGDEALLRFVSPTADLKSYSKVMLDPVMIYRPSDADQEQMADLQQLATNFYAYLYGELEKDYGIVKTPVPGTLRIQTAVLRADKSGPVRDLLSSVIPIGMGVSILKDFATGKPLGVGEVSAEMKITDAQTGDLLAAAVDRRVGGKNPAGMFNTWADANDAMEYWAKRLGYVLCNERGGNECVKP
jgi:hypothetical protein